MTKSQGLSMVVGLLLPLLSPGLFFMKTLHPTFRPSDVCSSCCWMCARLMAADCHAAYNGAPVSTRRRTGILHSLGKWPIPLGI